MKDIDFDELDKAVNSLMATTPELSQPEAATPISVTPSAQPVPATSAAPVAQTPVAPLPAQAPASSEPVVESVPATPVAPRSAPPATKRSGRFMDMVHASSDMKPRTETPAPSREGLSITPRPAAVEPAPIAPVPTENKQPSYDTSQSMPDPIDMAAAIQPLTEPEPAVPVEAETVVQPTAEPLGSVESPFLTDAKVEKRPLNAGTSNETVVEPTFDISDELVETEQAPSAEAEDNDKSSSDQPPLTPQIPELSSDLVAIESTGGTDVSPVAETPDESAAPVGPASIAQQYTSQPSTGDQSHAAIYDSSQYPEPLSHPAKNKSGWLWVLWVVLLLGVGAGGAFVLYNLGIIP